MSVLSANRSGIATPPGVSMLDASPRGDSWLEIDGLELS